MIALLMIMVSLPTFALTIRGEADTTYNSAKDNVYVGVVWHSDDGRKFNPGFSPEVGTIKNGKFKFKVTNLPPESSRKKLENSMLSVGYIVLFKDVNRDGQFTKDDKVVGICEKHCLTFVSGDLNKDLDKIEEMKERKMPTLRKLGQGLHLSYAESPDEHGMDSRFDDLISVKKAKVILTRKRNGKRLRGPNWT